LKTIIFLLRIQLNQKYFETSGATFGVLSLGKTGLGNFETEPAQIPKLPPKISDLFHYHSSIAAMTND
jgi:hypothetical protein